MSENILCVKNIIPFFYIGNRIREGWGEGDKDKDASDLC